MCTLAKPYLQSRLHGCDVSEHLSPKNESELAVYFSSSWAAVSWSSEKLFGMGRTLTKEEGQRVLQHIAIAGLLREEKVTHLIPVPP